MPPTTVRVHYRNEADLETARQALGMFGSPSDRHLAGVEAARTTAELTGRMERVFVDYKDHWDALTELKGLLPKKRGAEIAERRRQLHARTAWRLRADFTRLYRDQFRNGKGMGGNLRPLQHNEQEIVRRMVNQEMEFALNALLDCETGEFKMDLVARGRLYGNALGEAAQAGFVYANLAPDRYIRWRLGHPRTEDCPDCLWLAGSMNRQQGERDFGESALRGMGGRWGNGVYRAQELARMGIFPQSGRLICTTACQCRLEEVSRPAGTPHGAEARGWTSLREKVPTMLRRETEQGKRKTLARLAEAWEHRHIGRREKTEQPEHLHR